MNKVLAYLDLHRAKVAAFLAFAVEFYTLHQDEFTGNDKNRITAVIVSGLVMYLNGNRAYEQTKLQVDVNKQVLENNPPH